MTHWTERLYKDQADSFAELFERRFEDATAQVADVLTLLETERDATPERVLDVACGTGRHVLAFADVGLTVDGLDFSREFVERARDRATDKGLDDRTTFHVHDMRDLDSFGGQFDLVTCFWNSLGYYGRETDIEILASMRRLLADDGVALLELGNKEHYVREFDDSTVHEHDDGDLMVTRKEFDIETGRFGRTVDVFAPTDDGYDHRETMEWELRVYAPVELTEMCEAAGFEDVSLYGDLDGSDLTLDSPYTYVLASA